MQTSQNIRRRTLSIALAAALAVPLAGQAASIPVPGGAFNVGMRAQFNVNYIDEDVGTTRSAWDTSARRVYLYLGGKIDPNFSYFAHLGADRLGQGADAFTGGAITASSENGFVTGLAVRDGWINFAPWPEFQVQVGRMLVPFLRNFGTHSGFANMSYDYGSFQQTAMIPGRRVGRDDGVMLLGEIGKGLVTYRLAMMDGAANDTNTDRGKQRTAGRVAVSLWEPETGFWWQGTYLDTKRVLTIGAGFDRLDSATISPGNIADHKGSGLDVFLNLPLGGGAALTGEVNYARVKQTKVSGFGAATVGQKVAFSGDYMLVQVGYLLPGKTAAGQIQPYVRYEEFDYDSARFGVTSDVLTHKETAVGVNLYQKGHGTKVTLDYTKVDKKNDTTSNPDFNRIGVQLQVSF